AVVAGLGRALVPDHDEARLDPGAVLDALAHAAEARDVLLAEGRDDRGGAVVLDGELRRHQAGAHVEDGRARELAPQAALARRDRGRRAVDLLDVAGVPGGADEVVVARNRELAADARLARGERVEG